MNNEIEEKKKELVSLLLQMFRMKIQLKEMEIRCADLDAELSCYYRDHCEQFKCQCDEPERDAKDS